MITITNKASSMSKKVKPRTLKHQLGTEYSALFQDGINTQLNEYSVTFTDIPSVIATLNSTLDSLDGTTPFKWNPYVDLVPSSSALTFTCEEWTSQKGSPGKSTLSATFIQQADFS